MDPGCGMASPLSTIQVVVGTGDDGVCSGESPEEAIDSAYRRRGSVGVVSDALCGVVVETLECVAVVAERLQRDVTCNETRLDERLGDLAEFVVSRNVPDDAEQVADVSVLREGASGPLAVEDRDALEGGVSSVASDRGSEVLLGVDETETLESLVNEQPHEGILSSEERLLCPVLLAMAFE